MALVRQIIRKNRLGVALKYVFFTVLSKKGVGMPTAEFSLFIDKNWLNCFWGKFPPNPRLKTIINSFKREYVSHLGEVF